MVLASLQAAARLLRSPSSWLPGLMLGLFAGSSFALQSVAGLFIAERVFILELVIFPFFLAGLYFQVKTRERTFSSFAEGGVSGYFRVLLPSVVLVVGILVTILLLLIPLLIIGIGETVLPFLAVSVSITILFFASFYDTAAIIEERKVFDSIRRSVEFVVQHARDCVVFYLIVIIISAIIVFGLMILWTGALYDQILPLASYNVTQVQSFTIEQFNILLGPGGVFISSLFLFIGLTILVTIITCFKACFFRDRTAGPRTTGPEEVSIQQGEYDEKGRWYKY
jgi:hypothetical protein